MIEKIKFEVSAKTARLIGRENISGVNGALLELVKNSYDADSSFCKIVFDVPFLRIGDSINSKIIDKQLNEKEKAIFNTYYSEENGFYILNKPLTTDEERIVSDLLFKHNKIIVFDNGSGMDRKIIKNSWMRIGTDNKEINHVSGKGRIKTGAKGIGRFALDKLSKNTVVYTKNQNDNLLKWSIDWNSFNAAKNLSDINTELEIIDNLEYAEVLKSLNCTTDEMFSKYNFSTGTLIILSPTREEWSEKLFTLLNSNLDGINPLSDTDVFDVFVDNNYYSQYSFVPSKVGMGKADYDYFVNATFDGKDEIKIVLNRNEIDCEFNTITINSRYINNQSYEITNDKYWGREKFKLSGFTKTDYDKPYIIIKKVTELLKNESFTSVSKLGPLELSFYFFKQSRGGLEITKNVSSSRRKSLSNYSGVKIYRDNFKIRPYGEKGSLFFDWLRLGERSQKSPAAVTDQDGKWRVEPYQVIGNLKISRMGNPYLVDMANREGMEPNDTYMVLVELLDEVISIFEADRQYFLREYDAIKKELDPQKKVDEMIDSIKRAKSKKQQKRDYSKEEYEEAVVSLADQYNIKTNELKLLMALGSSGILTNTFSHEIESVRNGLQNGYAQLKRCIKRIIKEEDYSGDPDFNPYISLEDCNQVNRLLASWVGVLVNGIKKDSLKTNNVDVCAFIDKVADEWKPLLDKKCINIVINNYLKNSILLNISIADLYIILNNFILNSSWFLEEMSGESKNIYFFLKADKGFLILEMENNGPELDSSIWTNPYDIFELGTTSKKNKETGEVIGTGLGMWMIKKTVENNGAEMYFHVLNEGNFGIAIKFPVELKNG